MHSSEHHVVLLEGTIEHCLLFDVDNRGINSRQRVEREVEYGHDLRPETFRAAVRGKLTDTQPDINAMPHLTSIQVQEVKVDTPVAWLYATINPETLGPNKSGTIKTERCNTTLTVGEDCHLKVCCAPTWYLGFLEPVNRRQPMITNVCYKDSVSQRYVIEQVGTTARDHANRKAAEKANHHGIPQPLPHA